QTGPGHAGFTGSLVRPLIRPGYPGFHRFPCISGLNTEPNRTPPVHGPTGRTGRSDPVFKTLISMISYQLQP
ncbi:hypothetical protein A2U01_0067448, partial [Trifolium medium]|nr:hypothetical protein [Trifolium medium]